MTALRNLVVAVLFSLLVLNLLSSPVSTFTSNEECCVKYSMRPLPLRLISGYVEQQSNELCHIDAIIFYTVRGRAVCANPDNRWVKIAMRFLSKKLEKMSQEEQAAPLEK
ncbi:C-C motif chemokine 20-like [Heptranchias perlo]|uniref:C-C motif chemokine 20-like n=1 Tax=Heptranchias perlo TaxID=212740 RepID=UPI00355AC1CB